MPSGLIKHSRVARRAFRVGGGRAAAPSVLTDLWVVFSQRAGPFPFLGGCLVKSSRSGCQLHLRQPKRAGGGSEGSELVTRVAQPGVPVPGPAGGCHPVASCLMCSASTFPLVSPGLVPAGPEHHPQGSRTPSPCADPKEPFGKFLPAEEL